MPRLLGSIFAIFSLAHTPVAADDGYGGKGAERLWPQWRGALGTGVAPYANPPVEWSETKNVRWKTDLPGEGHSTPIVWGDRSFVTAAVPYGKTLAPQTSGVPGGHDEIPITHRYKFIVIAVNRSHGEIIWERTVREDLPHAGGHYTASLASQSAVTDGEHLFAYFGSYGLYCLDFKGETVWETDIGQMHTLHGHGEGSSPVLYRDMIIINWDHEGPSFVVAFDKRTGIERWKTSRDVVSSWTTPIVVEGIGKPQVIVSGSKFVQGYDPTNGKIIWECGGLSEKNVVSSPVANDSMVFVGSSYDQKSVLGIRFDEAKGDITGTKQVVWQRTRGAPYVPSSLLYGDSLYFIRHLQGIITGVNARTGEDQPGPFRLNGIGYVFASPVGAAGRLYISDRDGKTAVISHDQNPEVLAINRLNESFSASAAVVDNELFLRGRRSLYCITEEQ